MTGDLWLRLTTLAREYARAKYGRVAVRIALTLHDGERCSEPLPCDAPAEAPAVAPGPRSAPEAASGSSAPPASAAGPSRKGGRVVVRPDLDGSPFRLTPTQAAAVDYLAGQHAAGRAAVPEREVLRGCGSDADRLRDVFRRSPAFNTLVLKCDGGFRLA